LKCRQFVTRHHVKRGS